MEKTDAISGGKRLDMLHGPLAGKIFLFSLPIAASSMLQQLFNSADVAVVGRFAEEGALAAVGSNSVLVGLFVNIFLGLSVGANVIISQLIGQGKKREVSSVVHTAVLFSILCGLMMAALGVLIARPLLILTNAPANVLDRAVLYLRIYCLGMPFIIPYNFGAAILRSVGDTRRPMYCLIASGVLNVCLNLVLVIVFRLGVAGVAIATVLANVLSACAVLAILCRERGPVHLETSRLRIDPAALRHILRIGAPASLQSSVFALSNVCLQTAINSFGSSAVAGNTAAINFEYFTYYAISAFNQAAMTFAGQNLGAGQYDRCRKVLRLCMAEALIASAALGTAFFLGRMRLVRIYTTVPAEIEYALIRMTWVLPLTCIACSYEIAGSFLRGMGHSLVPALLTVLGSVVFRVFWIYTVFVRWPTLTGLLAVYPVSWVLTGAMTLTCYFLLRRRLYGGAPEDA